MGGEGWCELPSLQPHTCNSEFLPLPCCTLLLECIMPCPKTIATTCTTVSVSQRTTPNVLIHTRWVTGEKESAGQGEVQWDLGPEVAQKLQKPYRNPEQAGKGGQNHSLHTETKQTPCASYGTTRTDDNENDYTQFLSP